MFQFTIRNLVASLALIVLTRTAYAESARYRATFDVVWQAATHPTDIPTNPHFSGPIGATHHANVDFWRAGELASPGIQAMAEKGSRPMLTAEIEQAIAAGTAHSVVSFCCTLGSPGTSQMEFLVDASFPRVTLVTMIAPSPDWFVGVSNLPLHDGQDWIGRQVVDLHPYDAGTDSGITFQSPDEPTDPHVPITRISGHPFADVPPLGTLTFVRVVAGDVTDDGELSVDDIDELSRVLRLGSGQTRHDVNRDGQVNQQDRSYWLQTLKPTGLGDADLDGRFSTADLVQVFIAGEYEDSVLLNSGWASGDWTGDGEFTSQDLVAALSDGAYDAAATPAAAVRPIPEPTSLALTLLGLLGVCHGVRTRRR